jgi:hypothetical protein
MPQPRTRFPPIRPSVSFNEFIRKTGDDLGAALEQNGDGLRADQAGAADDDDLHT